MRNKENGVFPLIMFLKQSKSSGTALGKALLAAVFKLVAYQVGSPSLQGLSVGTASTAMGVGNVPQGMFVPPLGKKWHCCGGGTCQVVRGEW